MRKLSVCRILLIVLIVCVLTVSLATSILYSTKNTTCDTMFDVWKDIGLLLSQHQDDVWNFDHVLSCLNAYLTSNTLDGLLYEWRALNASDLTLGKPAEAYIYWDGVSRQFQSAREDADQDIVFASEPIELYILYEDLQFNDNPTELDYVYHHISFEVDSFLLLPQNTSTGAVVGYASRLTVTDSVSTHEDGTVKEENIYGGEAFDLEEGMTLRQNQLSRLEQKQGIYFDFSSSYYLAQH